MHRIYAALIEIAAALVFIIPLFGLYGKYILHDLKKTLIYIVLGSYFVSVLSLVGFPSIDSMKIDFTINVIPFVDMISDFVNACLNVLLFVPLGIFLPVLWDKYRNIKKTMFVALCITVGIELSQIFTFRTTDINDVITSATGTLIGYLIAKGVTQNFNKYVKSNANSKEFYIIFGMVVIIMFLLQPFVSSLLWETVL